MKVYKVADVINGKVRLTARGKINNIVPASLTNLEVLEDPDPNSKWSMEITIGNGPTARQVVLDLAPQLSLSTPTDRPVFLRPSSLVFFRNSLFLPEHAEFNETDCEEILLRVKKLVYEADIELSRLRAVVGNFEATIEFSKSEQRREPISENVKLLAWARDGGACAVCGSQQDLQFDHIIPFAKGGGNSEANIQILCQICNLRKSDKIAMN